MNILACSRQNGDLNGYERAVRLNYVDLALLVTALALTTLGVLAYFNVSVFSGSSLMYGAFGGAGALILSSLAYKCIAYVINRGPRTPQAEAKKLPKKKTEKSKKVKRHKPKEKKTVTGNIHIYHNATAGVLGADTSSLFSATQKIERVDGVDWTSNPNEFLVQFTVSNLSSSKSPLSADTPLFIPMCLFIKDGDYSRLKEEGNLIEFIYDGVRYELTLSESVHVQSSFAEAIKTAEEAFYNQKGARSVLPVKMEGKTFPRNEPKYLSPFDIQRHKAILEEREALQQKFKEAFPNATLQFTQKTAIATHELTEDFLALEMPRVKMEDITFLSSEDSFAIHAKQHPIDIEGKVKTPYKGLHLEPEKYPGFTYDAFLFLHEFNTELTRDMVKKGEKVLHEGYLFIKFKTE